MWGKAVLYLLICVNRVCGLTAGRLLTGPHLCFCQIPKTESMEKNEGGNGDALFCITQVAVILRPRHKVNESKHEPFLYVSKISPVASV